MKSTMTGTVTSSGRGGTAAAMAQNEQMAEEHSTLEQQPPGKLDHPAWCVMWMVQPASMLKHSKDADVNSIVQRFQLQESSALPTPLSACPMCFYAVVEAKHAGMSTKLLGE